MNKTICKICNMEFKKSSGLVVHIKSKHNIEIKDYYDKYYRKDGEGYCQFCGKETLFISLNKGYRYNVCKHCRNLNPKSKKIRSENYKKKKIINDKIKAEYEKENYEFKCEICGKYIKTINGLARHINTIHKNIMTIQEYYDKYFKKEGEGICPVTNKETKFKSLREGYFIYSGIGINSKDDKIKKLKKEIIIEKYGVTNPIFINVEQRIKNLKKTRKTIHDKKKAILKLIDLLRKQTIDKNNKNQCQICGKHFDNIWLHVTRLHKIKIKDYYDKYFKKEDEGICPVTNKETNFKSFVDGYFKYYKHSALKDPNIIKNAKNKLLKTYKKKILKNQKSLNIEIVNINQLNKNTDMIDLKCLKCGEIYRNRIYNLQLGYGKCPRCYPRNTHISKGEKELYQYVKSIIPQDIQIFKSYFGLTFNENNNFTEIDIYIPKKKIAIEFDGLYWHSDKFKDENYHLIKTQQCNDQGIQLIHVFEDEWFHKKDIVKSRLKNILNLNDNERIHARKCIIKEIDPKTKNAFLEKFHIQGKDMSNIKLGAFYDNELISVMTFSKGNITRGGDPLDNTTFELNRFCSNSNYHIPGIAGKLLKHFQRNYNWNKIFSFADLRWSDGNLYNKLGFDFIHQTRPDYFYYDTSFGGIHKIHRYNLRKTYDDPQNITEKELRKEQGYLRIYDCGKLKYQLENK